MGMTSTQRFTESLHCISDKAVVEEVIESLRAKDPNPLYIKDVLDGIEKGLSSLLNIRKMYRMK
jgi:hypothetical protein